MGSLSDCGFNQQLPLRNPSNNMKIKFIPLALLSAALALTSVSSALTIKDATFRDVDLINEVLDSSNPSISRSFDITKSEDGWRDIAVPNLSKFSILDAIIGFYFLQTDANSQTVVHSAEFRIGSYFNVSGVASDAVDPLDVDPEVASDPHPSSYFRVEFDPNLYPALGSLILDVSTDGIVDWTVSLSDADANNPNTSLTLFSGYLAVEAEPKEVPDTGSTAGFFGLVILGFIVAGKRFRRS